MSLQQNIWQKQITGGKVPFALWFQKGFSQSLWGGQGGKTLAAGTFGGDDGEPRLDQTQN